MEEEVEGESWRRIMRRPGSLKALSVAAAAGRCRHTQWSVV